MWWCLTVAGIGLAVGRIPTPHVASTTWPRPGPGRPSPLHASPGPHPVLDVLMDEPSVLVGNSPALSSTTPRELSRRYRRLGLRDVFLSYAGYRATDDPVHRAIWGLSAGDLLQVRAGTNRWELVDLNGTVVGQLAGDFEGPPGMRCAFALVSAIVVWDRQYSEPQYQQRLGCDSWEVVVPELVFEPDS